MTDPTREIVKTLNGIKSELHTLNQILSKRTIVIEKKGQEADEKTMEAEYSSEDNDQ